MTVVDPPARGVVREVAPVLAAVAVLAAALRAWDLFAFPIAPDTGPAVEIARRMATGGGLQPVTYAYPPLTGYVVGAVLWAVTRVDPSLATDPLAPYHLARVVTVVASTATVVLTGLLAALLAPAPRRRWWAGIAAGGMAVAYVAVRLGTFAKPDTFQLVFTVTALVAAVAYRRSRHRGWVLAAAACVGFAAAAKYTGGVLGLVVLAAVVDRDDVRRSAVDVVVVGAAAAVAFVVGTLGQPLLEPARFWSDVSSELSHQAGGHLGYEPESNGWWFHLGFSMPGSWGWPLTIAALVGAGRAVVGDRAQRLVLGAAVLMLATVAFSAVRFPHYTLVALPFLAVLGAMGVDEVAGRLARVDGRAATAVWVLAVLSLVPATLDAVRLANVRNAPDTRRMATELAADLDAPVVAESYTVLEDLEVAGRVGAFGNEPDVLDCDCVLAVSSYQEDRYRRRPALYPEAVAVYDAIRDRGEVLVTVEPATDLPYNWDGLPRWGLDRLPAFGASTTVGPTVTFVDLRGGVS